MTDDATAPATKGDLAALARKTDVAALRKDFTELETKLSDRLDGHDRQFDTLLQTMKAEGEETRRHFDVVAEKIHGDVAGVNKDEIEVLKDTDVNHEKRIGAIEGKLGLPSAA